VDVIRAYSKRPDVLEDLDRAVRQLDKALAEPAPERASVRSSGRVGHVQAIADRLSAEQVAAIIQRFRAGTAKHVLADEYGISLSSVKRLLRRHG
jgi:DNA-directed RNA polymerase specialized sigma24 family protein